MLREATLHRYINPSYARYADKNGVDGQDLFREGGHVLMDVVTSPVALAIVGVGARFIPGIGLAWTALDLGVSLFTPKYIQADGTVSDGWTGAYYHTFGE